MNNMMLELTFQSKGTGYNCKGATIRIQICRQIQSFVRDPTTPLP